MCNTADAAGTDLGAEANQPRRGQADGRGGSGARHSRGGVAVEGALPGLDGGDEHKAERDQQRPGAELADVDEVPPVVLVGVAPGPQEGRQVLREPQGAADEDEGLRCGHPVAVSADREVDGRPPQGGDEADGDQPAQVGDDVVGVEVRIGDGSGRLKAT